jgi:hypothetical protein
MVVAMSPFGVSMAVVVSLGTGIAVAVIGAGIADMRVAVVLVAAAVRG